MYQLSQRQQGIGKSSNPVSKQSCCYILACGIFANPQFLPIGIYDLRTEEGEFLIEYLSQPAGYPSGVVNRTPVNGDMQISLNQWASAITSAIQTPPAIDISIVRTYDVQSRQLVVTVSGIGKEELSGEIRLSIMLTESGIIDAQDDFEAGALSMIMCISMF